MVYWNCQKPITIRHLPEQEILKFRFPTPWVLILSWCELVFMGLV